MTKQTGALTFASRRFRSSLTQRQQSVQPGPVAAEQAAIRTTEQSVSAEILCCLVFRCRFVNLCGASFYFLDRTGFLFATRFIKRFFDKVSSHCAAIGI